MNGTAHAEPDLPAATEPEPDEPAHAIGYRPGSVAEGYARWAPIYDHDPNPLLAREERHLLPLLAGLHCKRVLDLACGTGRWLEKLGGELGVGLDRSDPMLRVAGRKCTLTGRLTRAACESLPFCSGAFDLAICSFALGHIPDLRLMARELARVTTPAADLFVSDLHPQAYARGWRVGFRDGSAAVQIETVPRTAEQILQPFRSHGFECLTQAPLWLGEPEKALFARAGKSDLFATACDSPAVLVFHFKRCDSPGDIGAEQ